jgi:hypothetical protein
VIVWKCLTIIDGVEEELLGKYFQYLADILCFRRHGRVCTYTSWDSPRILIPQCTYRCCLCSCWWSALPTVRHTSASSGSTAPLKNNRSNRITSTNLECITIMLTSKWVSDSMKHIILEKLTVAQLASQDITSLLWNRNIYYLIYKNPQFDRILSHYNSIHTRTRCWYDPF